MEFGNELFKNMRDIEYGWIDKSGHKYIKKIVKEKFITDWFLQSPKEVATNKIGICWDQVEYERKFFEKQDISYKTIFVIYKDGIKNPMHTFLIFKNKKKYYWFENTYQNSLGINQYTCLEDCFNDIKTQFKKENNLEEIGEKLYWYIYEKPKYGINAEDFVKHCINGILIDKDLKNLNM